MAARNRSDLSDLNSCLHPHSNILRRLCLDYIELEQLNNIKLAKFVAWTSVASHSDADFKSSAKTFEKSSKNLVLLLPYVKSDIIKTADQEAMDKLVAEYYKAFPEATMTKQVKKSKIKML